MSWPEDALWVLSLTLDSNLDTVSDAEEQVRRFAQDAGFEESDRYFIGLAFREILINAIKHGNRFDPNKKAGAGVSTNGKDLTIEVTDEGDGFRVENVPDPRLAENLERPSGRGIAMARAVMDELSIEANSPNGTRVRMLKRVPPRPASQVVR